MDLPAEGELDATGGEVIADSAGVGDGAGKPVELRHDEGVSGANGGQCLVQAEALAVGAGQAVVEVDPLVGYAELAQSVALRGEILLVAIRTPSMIGRVTGRHPSLRNNSY